MPSIRRMGSDKKSGPEGSVGDSDEAQQPDPSADSAHGLGTFVEEPGSLEASSQHVHDVSDTSGMDALDEPLPGEPHPPHGESEASTHRPEQDEQGDALYFDDALTGGQSELMDIASINLFAPQREVEPTKPKKPDPPAKRRPAPPQTESTQGSRARPAGSNRTVFNLGRLKNWVRQQQEDASHEAEGSADRAKPASTSGSSEPEASAGADDDTPLPFDSPHETMPAPAPPPTTKDKASSVDHEELTGE